MRKCRWKPVCPECGYSLRRLTSLRCPECGTEFPGSPTASRRWAFRRIPWDRERTEAGTGANVETLRELYLHPARAATGLLHPDHWKWALRWAASYILITAAIGALMGHNQYFWTWLVERFRGEDPAYSLDFLNAPAGIKHVLLWYGQSVFAWTVGLVSIPLCGVLLSWLIPRRHATAKRGGMKLSLYLSALLPGLLAIGFVYRFWFHIVLNQWLNFQAFRFPARIPHPLTKMTLLALVFGIYWGIGMAANPMGRPRGRRGALLFVGLFWGTWVLLTRVLFPVGVLRTWL